MTCLLISLFFILFLEPLHSPGAEELIRVAADQDLEGRVLYRAGDDRADAELEILRSEDGEWSPAVIFLDTPWYQAGSLAPAGLWRFCSMKDLLSEGELSRETGLKADRSDSSLKRPAFAIRLPDSAAGVLFKQDEDHRFGAFWLHLDLSPYCTLELGEGLLFPEEEEEDTSWFPGEDKGGDDPTSITAFDLRWERRDAGFQIRGAGALSPYRKPSYSLLPGWRFYLEQGELSSRIWYSSETWRGSALEEPDWHFLWENGLILRFPGQLLLIEGDLAGGMERAGGFGGRCGGSVEITPGPFELKLDAKIEERGSEEIRIHSYGGRIRYTHGDWRESLGGDITLQKRALEGWSLSAELKRSPRSGRFDKLGCRWTARPGRLSVEPSLECSVPFGQFRLHGALSYELLYSKEPLSADEAEPLSFRLTGEWKGR